jgi:hypothetical protein
MTIASVLAIPLAAHWAIREQIDSASRTSNRS